MSGSDDLVSRGVFIGFFKLDSFTHIPGANPQIVLYQIIVKNASVY